MVILVILIASLLILIAFPYFCRFRLKYTVGAFGFLMTSIYGYAQKPSLDTSVFRAWPKVESGCISNDGKYVSYKISYYGYLKLVKEELVIQSVSCKWTLVISNFESMVSFSQDSKAAYVSLKGDSLAIYKLGTNDVSYMTNVTSFQSYKNCFIYTLKSDDAVLHVNKLDGKDELLIDSVSSFVFNEQNKSLVISRSTKEGLVSLFWYDLDKNSQNKFWQGYEPNTFTFDHTANHLAFLGNSNGISGIWLVKSLNSDAHLLVQNSSRDFDSTLRITGIRGFSDNDQYLFYLSTIDNAQLSSKMDSTGAKVTIWSYSDVMLKSEVKAVGPRAKEYVYAIHLSTRKITPITSSNEELQSQAGDCAIVNHYSGQGDPEEKYWNPHSQLKIFILSLSSGRRTELFVEKPLLSRQGKYVLYYNPQDRNFYTYETTSGAIFNITEATKTGNNVDEFIEPNGYRSYWLDNDSAVIVFAKRDIWLLDPKGLKKPFNVTHGYGLKCNILFNPIDDFSEAQFNRKEPIILIGFNQSNKENGFYRTIWNENADPEKLIMDGHIYYMPRAPIENGFDNKPIKSRDANVWLIKRMSEKEAPNYFTTTDFKKFHVISNIHPQSSYNWLTTELHSWKSFNGDSLQGILYKPEDFNPNKKYPIIFHYYNQFSRNLHAFLDPGVSIGPMNVPWYVSQGYLVFIPDISYKEGETGPSAYNSVVSAAVYMKNKHYVDSTKMGIQGHSFGGYQTNYIITQTGIFAAACSSSGVTDLISFAGGFGVKGTSNHWMSSGGQIGLGVRLWDDPQRFIRNSPIFYLDKVTTPLLAMHTTGDKAVAFSQAFELFTGLRQFRKKVWLLMYEGENHILRDEQNSLDYTIRQTQFFNYYLKDMEEPDWMKNEGN